MTNYSIVKYEQPGVTVCYAAPHLSDAPTAAPIHGLQYYVYRCAATKDHPFEHWKYYPATMGTNDLPDIRGARPLYIWSSITGRYSVIDKIAIKY
jgi:hypothetical protein